MSRNIIFTQGEFYHIYNRGTERRDIFLNRKDYERFITLLYICNGEAVIRIDNFKSQIQQGRTLLNILAEYDLGKPLVQISAYCLMPNHFHLLIHEEEEKGISRFMQRLTTAYTMYFNKKYTRTGVLFQGKFKASHVGDDNYLKYLISYIHLNPIKLIDSKWKENGIKDKKKAQDYLGQYIYSSYPDYLGTEREMKVILNTSCLPEYWIDSSSSFESMVTEWLDYGIQQGRTLLD